MNATELIEIKKYQKQFKEKFNKDLCIDFVRMKGIIDIPVRGDSIYNMTSVFTPSVIDNWFYKTAKSRGVDLDIIRNNKKVSFINNLKEYKFLIEFAKMMYKRNWRPSYCANLVNKSRAALFFYAGKSKQKPIT